MSLKNVLVNTRAVIETIYPSLAHYLTKILVALLVLGKQYKVPAATVNGDIAVFCIVMNLIVRVFVKQGTTGAVGLHAQYGLHGFVSGHLIFKFGYLLLKLRLFGRVICL